MINILKSFEETVAAYPEKTAVAYREKRYSFKALSFFARCLANKIPKGMRNCPIGVFSDRSADVALYFLSAIYSGNYYVPIDPDMPREKIQAILSDADIHVILGATSSLSLLSKLDYSGLFFSLEDADDAPCPFPDNGDGDPIYMVYTSGSTGKPKGVLKSHSSVVSYLDAFLDTFQFNSEEIIGNQTPFFFDAAAKDFYLMLKTGATIEILPTELFAMPPMLIEYLNEKRITFLSWVPTALSVVSQLRTFSYIKPETVKRVFFVGEVMPMKHLNYWRKNLPNIEYVNLYGSSEIAGICCYYPVKGDYNNDETLPIGKPLKNCTIFLMKDDAIITAPDQIGEIYLASPALALEYFGDPEKTSKHFLYKVLDGKQYRCFKTGDLASYDQSGNLIFASRADFQIKHMGHRIELGEIEAVAGALPQIHRCCCLYNTERRHIVLFCQLSDKIATPTEQSIKSLLRPKLSTYMLPSKIVIMEQLPLNANGKIDRQLLKALL